MFPRLLVLAPMAIAFCVACSSEDRAPAAAAPDQPCTNTIRLGALQDKSASSTPNGVYQMRPDDLRPPAEPIIRCGGELALGIVGDPSGAPLHRWSVEVPGPAPRPPADDGTPINAAIDNANYETELARWSAKNDARVALARNTFEAFIKEITPLLSQEADDPRTPLWLALARVDAFLGEPDTSAMQSHRYLVLSSDGKNTAGKPTTLNSGATLFISNGSQAIGALNKLSFTIVENPVGAFRKIIDLENAHVSNKS